MFRKICVFFGLTCLAACANATPTGLFLMPIADILKHREGFAFAGLLGTERNVSKGYSYFNAATVGILDRAEIGYDNDFLGNTTYNIKVQLFDSPKQLPGSGLSVGLVNCNGSYREPYIVGKYEFKDFRLHAGYWNTMGCGRMMVGVDFPVFGEGSVSLEFLSGPGSVSWGSIYMPINALPGLGAVLAVGVPSNRSEGIQHSALLMYSFKL
jgi:hypothetical protein